MKIAVIGAGFTGLTTAYYLAKKKHKVVIFEKEKFLGGLSSGIKIGDWYLERFYHHIFKSDKEIIELTKELGLGKIWLWRKSNSPIFWQGRIYPFSTAWDLLRFKPLPFSQRIATGLSILFLKLNKNYQKLENIKAENWLKKYMGEKSWQLIWQPLLEKKFANYANNISMVWMWARIHKRSLFLGYPKKGFQAIISKLASEIKKNKGKIFLKTEIKNLNQLKNFEKIIFTTASPIFEKITKIKVKPSIPYLGTIAFLLELKNSFTKDVYWLNINDFSFPFLALIEQTNFIDSKNYQGRHFVYLGAYLDNKSETFKKPEAKIFNHWQKYLKKINPHFKLSWIKKTWFFKEAYAQPVFQTGVKPQASFYSYKNNSLYLVNMANIYPWDRGVNYAVKISKEITSQISS